MCTGLCSAVVDHAGTWEDARDAYLHEVLVRRRGHPAALAILYSEVLEFTMIVLVRFCTQCKLLLQSLRPWAVGAGACDAPRCLPYAANGCTWQLTGSTCGVMCLSCMAPQATGHQHTAVAALHRGAGLSSLATTRAHAGHGTVTGPGGGGVCDCHGLPGI